MTGRKNSRPRGALDAAIENLPERFLAPEVRTEAGQMTGLAAYMADLGQHLREVLGTDSPPTIDVMTAIGIPPSRWYRAALEENHAQASASRRDGRQMCPSSL